MNDLNQAEREVTARLKADNQCDPLEKRALLAIIDNDPESARLLDVMEKRNSLGLSVIKGGKEALPQPS